MNTIKQIDGDLLKAILAGGRIVHALSRQNEETGQEAHVVTVEMPKDIIVDDLSHGERKYWKYLLFRHDPTSLVFWHMSSNNLSKSENNKKIWEEWSELKYTLKIKF